MNKNELQRGERPHRPRGRPDCRGFLPEPPTALAHQRVLLEKSSRGSSELRHGAGASKGAGRAPLLVDTPVAEKPPGIDPARVAGSSTPIRIAVGLDWAGC
jgi:hypothetical protein